MVVGDEAQVMCMELQLRSELPEPLMGELEKESCFHGSHAYSAIWEAEIKGQVHVMCLRVP